MSESNTELTTAFELAQQTVKSKTGVGNDVLLDLYALFKQANSGDVAGGRPGMLDIRGRAKYDAWAGRKGMSAADAQRGYVELVASLR
jgi:acyl-CoA-binding protein